MEEIKKFVLKGSYLTIRCNGEKKIIPIPQGLITSETTEEKAGKNKKTKRKKINPKLFSDDNEAIIADLNGESVIISTLPTWREKTKNKRPIMIRLAAKPIEQRAGKKLLLDHYMGVPSRGLFVNAYDISDSPLIACDDKLDYPVIACGCIDRMYYAMPVGRKKIADLAGRKDLIPTWNTNDRSKVVNQLRIAWISRLVVHPSYQNEGVGTLMAKTMGTIAHEVMLPHADFIEVIASYPAKNDEVYNKIKHLYANAGFDIYQDTLKSSPIVFLDKEDEGYVSAKKLYCYKDLRS